jgi:ketosteroid isomerase-like protein
MTDQAVGVVRVAYETWNRHGPGAIEPMLSEDVELHDAPELPDAQVWRGPEAVVERLQGVAESVGGGYVEFLGFIPKGDAVLVTMVWELGTEARHTEIGKVFHLVDVKDGKIARLRVFMTEPEADALN